MTEEFNSAMEYVEGFGYPEHEEDRHGKRTAWILKETGLQEKLRSIPYVITAGSCGKASSSRFLAFIVSEFFSLTGVNKPVGLGTKPPLFEDNNGNRERYQLLMAGENKSNWISVEDFLLSVGTLEPFIEYCLSLYGTMASYDVRYAVLADYFTRHDTGFAIFEANIGLKDDPSSSLLSPCAIMLNTVGGDHLKQLKPPDDLPLWLEDTAHVAGPVWHKAGGLKEDIPAIIGKQEDHIMNAIIHLAEIKKAGPLCIYGRDFFVKHSRCTILGSKAEIVLDSHSMDIELSVPGAFHLDNAILSAYTAYLLWKKHILKGTFSQITEAIKKGLKKATCPGRMEVIRERPVTLISAGASSLKFGGLMHSIGELMKNSGKENIILCATFITRVEEPLNALKALINLHNIKMFLPALCYEKEHSKDQANPLRMIELCEHIRPDIFCKYVGGPLETYDYALKIADPDRDIILLAGTAMAGTILKHSSSETAGEQVLAYL